MRPARIGLAGRWRACSAGRSRMLLVLDNRDSFTFNLAQALAVLGARVVVRRAADLSLREVAQLCPERVLIGPGPGRPEAAATSLAVLRQLDLPMLGVCLGHQALALAYGGRVVRAREPVHGRVVSVEHDGRGVFRHLPSPLCGTRYNSLTVQAESLPDCLEVSARSADGEVLGLRHRQRPLEGVQFHPEAVRSERGLELLANFLRL
jgi:anthranilate synthase/aminodeoxychorismate synthase-like glutamine amidotransferase